MKPIVLVTKAAVDFSEIDDKEAISDIVELVDGVGHDDIPFTLDCHLYWRALGRFVAQSQ